MNDELQKLIISIDEFRAKKISADALEQYTLSLIADDRFDRLDEEKQSAVFILDNNELNNLTDGELEDIKNTLAQD